MKRIGFDDDTNINDVTFNRFLLDNSPDAMLFATPDGVVLAANPVACRLFGRSEEEICSVGRNGLVDLEAIHSRDDFPYRTQPGEETVEIPLKKGDGSCFPAEISVRVFPFGNNELRALVIIRDITEQRASEQRFHLMVNSMGETVFTLDKEMRYTGVYGYWKSDYSSDTLIGKTLREISNTPDIPMHEEAISKALSGEHYTYEWSQESRFGLRSYQTSYSPLHDENGNITGVVGTARDITDLRQAQAHYQLLAENSVDIIYKFNIEDETFSYASPSVTSILGYRPEDKDYLRIPDILTAESYQKHKQTISNFITQGLDHQVDQLDVIHKNGSIVPVEVNVRAIRDKDDNPVEIIGVLRDITERKMAEESLRESEAFTISLLEASPYPINVINLDLSIRYVNPAFVEITGFSADELIGHKPPYPYWAKDISVESIKLFHDAMIRGIKGEEGRFVKKNGEEFWVRITNTPIKDDEKVTHILSNWIDITNSRKSEIALKDSEERYRSLVNNISLGIFRTSPDLRGRFFEVNRAMEHITGYSREELLSTDVADLFVFPEEREKIHNEFKDTTSPLTREALFRKKDGTEIRVSDTKVPVRDSNGDILYFDGILEDITQREKTEEENRKMARLESVGLLAGGIAHDFNNLLMGIMGNISLAIIEIGENQEVLKSLQEAEMATERASELTRQLLTFSRGGKPVTKKVDISGLIKDSSDFAMRGTGNKSEFFLDDDLWMVEADESQMTQIITNLVINACEATPTSDIIKISASNAVIQESSLLPLSPGNYVRFSVQDNGTGIEPQYLEKLFDPYFTTKETGNGLGLATTYSIVKNHHGHIKVESELGHGTVFTVYIPANDKPGKKTQEKEIGKDTGLSGGKILVMDDEKYLRQVVGRILGKIGYTAHLTANGTEAIKAYTEAMKKGEPFDAVILDLTIPGGMGGLETIQKLRELNPEVKAIVSSGYISNPTASSYLDYGFKAVVNKPYSVGRMETALKKLLGK